jgi:diacylglycerol kinase (ATP)
MKTKQFSFRSRANSFRFAWEGICNFFQHEHNAWLHLSATIAMLITAWCFRVSRSEMILLVIVTGLVWTAEIFNTAIERIMDFISPEYHPEIKSIKDLAAAAVLVASFIALVTGAFIFIPKFY